MLVTDPSVADLYIRGANGEELSEVDELRFRSLCNDLHWSAVLMYDRAVQLERQMYAKATVSWVMNTLKRNGMKSCWDRAKDNYSSFVGSNANV